MTGTRPVLVIAGGQRPHELLLLVVAVITGLTYVLGAAPPPGSVAALIPSWETRIWAGVLLVSGIVGLAGCLWRRDLRFSLRLELGGMLLGIAGLLVYTVAVFQFGASRALFPGLTAGLWMAANLWRAWQIRRDLKGM